MLGDGTRARAAGSAVAAAFERHETCSIMCPMTYPRYEMAPTALGVKDGRTDVNTAPGACFPRCRVRPTHGCESQRAGRRDLRDSSRVTRTESES